MSACNRSACCQTVDLCECTALGPRDGPQRLRWLVRRVADDDRDAFTELFGRCYVPVSSALRRQVVEPRRFADVFAGTFVEVWWLAGCHIDPGTDVMVWIDQIVQRRVTDTQPPTASPADLTSPSLGSPDELWPHSAEVQLAELLGPNPS